MIIMKMIAIMINNNNNDNSKNTNSINNDNQNKILIDLYVVFMRACVSYFDIYVGNYLPILHQNVATSTPQSHNIYLSIYVRVSVYIYIYSYCTRVSEVAKAVLCSTITIR